MNRLLIAFLACLAPLVVAAEEPAVMALTYDQNEDRSNFISLVRKARQGDTESQWQVASTYVRLGEFERAVPILNEAAAAGHAPSASLIGWLHEGGRGVAKSSDEARRWYRLAAEKGQADAMAALGRLLLQERGPEARESAMNWLRNAARMNDRDGQYHLGWLLAQPGPAHDDVQAADMFLKAARQGHLGAQVAAATHLLAGRGVEKDRKAALEWLERAATTGDPVAHYLLGRLHQEKGRAGLARARDAYRIAATAGHREAQFALASILIGSREEADRKEGAAWLAKAHEAGHRAAANRLGEVFRDGVGVPQQLGKAKDYFLIAANRKDASAMYNLARMQDDGLGGARDTDQALEWYVRAAAEGHQEAAAVVEGLLNSSVKTSDLGLKGFWQ